MQAASLFLLKLFTWETPIVQKNTPSSYTGDRSGYTAGQSKTLDDIGDALKNRRINFHIATTLRDLVRSGQVDEARERLRRFKQDSKLVKVGLLSVPKVTPR